MLPIFKGNCEAVYFPENVEEVVTIVKQANTNKTKLTIAGNGTGLTGARVPQNGIVIATDKLNNILEINSKESYALVEPAVLLLDFQKEIKQQILFYLLIQQKLIAILVELLLQMLRVQKLLNMDQLVIM